jgi:predicted choloylglycine hydrolase
MYRFEGNYHQIGVEYGMLLRSNRIVLPHISQTRLEFTQACEPFVRQHAPELIEEIEGLVEGSGYDLERMKMAALALAPHPACSVVAVAGQHTVDGKTLVGRNHDWRRGVLGYVAFCETHPQGAIASFGVNDDLVGRYDGINTAGVAIGMTAVEGGRDHPGIMFNLAARIVLDRCHTTEEAVTFLTQIQHARSVNFLVADSSGDIAMIEAAPERTHAIRPDNGFAAITNQFQSDEMVRYEKVRRRPANSYRRLCTLREWFAGEGWMISAKDMQGILSMPYPRGVCALPLVRQKGFSTIWSWTASLGTGSIDFASDSPVETPYRTFLFS